MTTQLKDLNQFNGSEQYHNVMGMKCTDGVAYLLENNYAWFVTDSIVILRMEDKVKTQEFVTVKLKLKGTTAIVEYSDGNNNVLYTQKYGYTDATEELKLYCTDGVYMLSSEY